MRRAGVVREMPKERRVVKLGTIIDEGESARFVPTRARQTITAAADSQYDVPTFLRKQAD